MVILNPLIISVLWICFTFLNQKCKPILLTAIFRNLRDFSSLLSFNYDKAWGSLQLTSTCWRGQGIFFFLWDISNSKKKKIIKSVGQCWCNQDLLNTPFFIEKNIYGIFRVKCRCPCPWRTESYSTGADDPGLLIKLPHLLEIKGVSPTCARWFSLGVGCYSTHKGISICPNALLPLLTHD